MSTTKAVEAVKKRYHELFNNALASGNGVQCFVDTLRTTDPKTQTWIEELGRKIPEVSGVEVFKQWQQQRDETFSVAVDDTDGGDDPDDANDPLDFIPFPSHLLPSPLQEIVREGSRAIGCDQSFIALPVMSAAGAAIGNTIRLVVKKGWTVPPTTWTLIVGESGTAKSPAFKVAKSAIQRHQKNLIERYDRELADYETAKEAYDAAKKSRKRSDDDPAAKPQHPVPVRCVVSDTTVEALAPILSHNPRGVLLQRDELNGWLGSFNQYKSTKGADESHWLSMFDGESITVDRKGEGTRPTFVDTALVSITGGIQPAILAKSMNQEHRASGLASRFLLASPPRRPQRWTDEEITDETQLAFDRLFIKLFEIDFGDGESEPSFIGMSSEAKQVWRDFFNRHHEEQAELIGDAAAAWSKLIGYVPRVALLFHIIKQVHDDLPIGSPVTPETMTEAITVVEWFKHEATRLYATIDDTDEEREQRELIEWIDRKHGGTCTVREVARGQRRFKDAEDAEKALQQIAKRGWGYFDTSDRKKIVFHLS